MGYLSSLAIWCKKINENPAYLDVHFNFWKVPVYEKTFLGIYKKYEYEYFLDIGLLVEDIKNIHMMYIFLPLLINRSEIKDLGVKLHKNNKLINAIFNEDYTIKYEPVPKQVKVNGYKRHYKIYNLCA